MSSPIKNRNLTQAAIKSTNKTLSLTLTPIKTDSNKVHKQDTKPDIKLKQDVKKPDTYEEEKVALVLGITAVFTVWWMFK